MNTFLITGSTGFLGSKLIEKLLQKDYKLICLIRKTSHIGKLKALNEEIIFCLEEELNSVFENNNINCVIHIATNYGYNQTNFVDILECNYLLPAKLLKLCFSNNVKYFINTDSLINKNINLYSLTKAHFRELCQAITINEALNVNIINLKLDHFYGPGDNNSKFIMFLIQSLLKNIDEIDLTPGEQKRRFLYVDDLINAIDLIIKNIDRFKFYSEIDITGEKLFSIKEIVSLIKKMTLNNCTKLNWGALEYRENEIFKPKADLNIIKKLGWEQSISIEEGIKRTINYVNK